MKVLIIGGNRFFGRHLATECLREADQVTLLNRGNLADNLIGKVQRLKVDRNDVEAMTEALKGKTWDIVFDQICYDARTAREAVKLFRGKVGRYVYTSSISVYGDGEELKEGNLDARDVVSADTLSTVDYGKAKLEAESVFAQELSKIAVSVRLGMVAGEDDYTGRLKWHIDHIRNGTAMKFPNKLAKLSFIHSEQAGKCLNWIGKSSATGAVNCAAPGGVVLGDFIKMVELGVKRKAIITSTGDESPYGIEKDLWVDTGRLEHMGIILDPVQVWMPKVVEKIARTGNG